MGLFSGAVFSHGGGASKQPIKQPTEMPTSTMTLMGRFPSSMGRFPTLMGRFSDFVPRGRFASCKSTGKQPIKKRGIKRFLNCDGFHYVDASGQTYKILTNTIRAQIQSHAIFPRINSPERRKLANQLMRRRLLN